MAFKRVIIRRVGPLFWLLGMLMKLFGKTTKKDDDSYFKLLSKEYRLPEKPEAIYAALNTMGEWKATEEWRMATWSDFRISKIESASETFFKVEVKCDHEFTCHCPTIERAVEMTNLYQSVIEKMFYQVGWPSWLSSTEHPKKHA